MGRIVVMKLASAVLEWSLRKLRSATEYEVTVRLNLTDDMEEMIKNMEAMEPVLEDAEMQETRWPMMVRQAAYDIADLADELEDMRTSAAGMLQMTGMLPCLSIVPKNPLADRMKLMKARLQMLREEAHSDNYMTSDKIIQEVIYARRTTPDLDLVNVVGRVEEKESIIAVLSATASDTTQGPIILPIFGLGGIGKTTLAAMVFNDIQLEEYTFRAWVHVSPDFDLHKIGMSIISQVSEEDINNIGSNDIEYIANHLRKLLTGMKVLIVLDDLWEEDSVQLERLKCMLSIGKKIIVIVTSQSAAIVREIGSIKPYKLNPLSDEMCWTIIKRTSYYQYRFRKEEIEQIGRKLARKCLGVPLAAKEVELVLQYKDLHVWEEKLASTTILQSSADNGLVTSLILSCRGLPPNLKLCFAYSGIFKEGHNMVKQDLIHQWIALDFIEPSDIIPTSQIAEEYFSRLLDISFLQTTESSLNSGKDDKGAILYTMHNLVHSVAVSVIGEEFIAIDGRDELYNLFGYCRYAMVNLDLMPLMLSTRLPVQLRALHCVGCSEMELNDDSFSFARCLRVLSLSKSSMKKLPKSVCQLRHMGYLNLSGCSGLVTLPESLGDLINLLHMNLSGCSGLVKLPQSFGNLMNLLYLDFSGCCGLVKLPQSFGNLIKLSHIVLSGCYELVELGESFADLKKLVYLDMSFWSCFDEILLLWDLTNLQHLNLSRPSYFVGEKRYSLELLDISLGQLTNLRHLNLSMCLNPILYYKSEEDSLKYIESCISGLSSLEHLDLSHNIFLRELPKSVGDNLSKLHTLDVSGCVRLRIVHRWMGELDCLKLDYCRGLESYHFVVHVDTDHRSSNLAQLEDANYQELEISCLEKVKSTTEAQRIRLVEKQKLRKLKLCWTVGSQGSVEENALLGGLMPPQNLQCLELHGYNGETCLPSWWTWRVCSHLVNLVEVTMDDIPRCRRLPALGLLPNLQQVTLRKMASLTRVDASDLGGGSRAAFKRLSKVTIDDMEILEAFMFPGVDELVIRKCPELSFGPLPPRARRLVVSESDKVMTMSSLAGNSGAETHGDAEVPSTSSTPVSVLVVERCDAPQGDWNLLHLVPGLKILCISQCDSMTSLPKYLGNLSSLRELAIDGCSSIESLPPSIFKLPNLRALYISDCHPALKIWCEAEENKKRLAPLGLKYEHVALPSLATSLLCF
uniref:Uncharacterized protein n=1 Tax=Avena sativa TaxID=4498 RepID=A0ACD5YZH2_AVESA